MRAAVTRRALLGATAAVGACALPGVPSALASPATAIHPDAELFRLLDAWGRLHAASEAADARTDALWDEAERLKPPRPAALRFNGADGLNCSFEVETLPDGRRRTVYGFDEINTLSTMPLPTLRVWESEPVGRWVFVPDERRIARRAEVLAAHHEWAETCRAVEARVGYDDAAEVGETATEALYEVEQAILGTVPLTWVGLVAKARHADRPELSKVRADLWRQRVAADVVAMADRNGVPS